jgi:hypothetical protein
MNPRNYLMKTSSDLPFYLVDKKALCILHNELVEQIVFDDVIGVADVADGKDEGGSESRLSIVYDCHRYRHWI